MATNDLDSPKPSDASQMTKLASIQGTAAAQPGQGARTRDSGTGTVQIANDRARLDPLFRPARPEPDQGRRDEHSGTGTVTVSGRGTMEKK